MSKPLNDRAVAELIAENARLRKLAEVLHDSVCPVESERFPQHGHEVCHVFLMDASQQKRYWYLEACKALGLHATEADVSEWNVEMTDMFQVGTCLCRGLGRSRGVGCRQSSENVVF